MSSYIDCRAPVHLHDYDSRLQPYICLLILCLYFYISYCYGKDFLICSMLSLLLLETIHLNRVKVMKYEPLILPTLYKPMPVYISK